MNLEHFKEILTKNAIYLYPNIRISNEISFPGPDLVVLNDDGTMNAKGDQSSDLGYRISREQPFLPNDVNLLKIFIEENNTIESYTNIGQEYKDAFKSTSLTKAISMTLSPKSSSTILNVIDALSHMAERTYEGEPIRIGVIINDVLSVSNKKSNLLFSNFIQANYAAVLTNGSETFIEIDSDGYIYRYLQLNSEKSELGLAPYDYTSVIQYIGKDTIGIALSNKGELLIFHDNELKYTKRGDRWNPYNHSQTIKAIHERSENDNLMFARAVYLTALDISFGKSGGIISFLDENEVRNALAHINIHDIVNEKYYNIKRELMKEQDDPEYDRIKDLSFEKFLEQRENSKSSMLNKLISEKKFFLLSRKLRQEITSIDGATIVDYNGDVVACGAIVKIEAGSLGGGRIAAARTLSHYGIAIEISSDSSIKGFALDASGEPERIFTIADFGEDYS